MTFCHFLKGVQRVKINGVIHHLMGPLQPADNKWSQFAQRVVLPTFIDGPGTCISYTRMQWKLCVILANQICL